MRNSSYDSTRCSSAACLQEDDFIIYRIEFLLLCALLCSSGQLTRFRTCSIPMLKLCRDRKFEGVSSETKHVGIKFTLLCNQVGYFVNPFVSKQQAERKDSHKSIPMERY